MQKLRIFPPFRSAARSDRMHDFVFDLIYLRQNDAALKSYALLLTMQTFHYEPDLSDLSRSCVLMADYANPHPT